VILDWSIRWKIRKIKHNWNNHFFGLVDFLLNLMPLLIVRLLLLLCVLHLDSLDLFLFSFWSFFYYKIDDSLSDIPKYSCITFSYFDPNFGYLLIYDKVILSNSFTLRVFCNLGLWVDFVFTVFGYLCIFGIKSSFAFFLRPLGYYLFENY